MQLAAQQAGAPAAAAALLPWLACRGLLISVLAPPPGAIAQEGDAEPALEAVPDNAEANEQQRLAEEARWRMEAAVEAGLATELGAVEVAALEGAALEAALVAEGDLGWLPPDDMPSEASSMAADQGRGEAPSGDHMAEPQQDQGSGEAPSGDHMAEPQKEDARSCSLQDTEEGRCSLPGQVQPAQVEEVYRVSDPKEVLRVSKSEEELKEVLQVSKSEEELEALRGISDSDLVAFQEGLPDVRDELAAERAKVQELQHIKDSLTQDLQAVSLRLQQEARLARQEAEEEKRRYEVAAQQRQDAVEEARRCLEAKPPPPPLLEGKNVVVTLYRVTRVLGSGMFSVAGEALELFSRFFSILVDVDPPLSFVLAALAALVAVLALFRCGGRVERPSPSSTPPKPSLAGAAVPAAAGGADSAAMAGLQKQVESLKQLQETTAAEMRSSTTDAARGIAELAAELRTFQRERHSIDEEMLLSTKEIMEWLGNGDSHEDSLVKVLGPGVGAPTTNQAEILPPLQVAASPREPHSVLSQAPPPELTSLEPNVAAHAAPEVAAMPPQQQLPPQPNGEGGGGGGGGEGAGADAAVGGPMPSSPAGGRPMTASPHESPRAPPAMPGPPAAEVAEAAEAPEARPTQPLVARGIPEGGSPPVEEAPDAHPAPPLAAGRIPQGGAPPVEEEQLPTAVTAPAAPQPPQPPSLTEESGGIPNMMLPGPPPGPSACAAQPSMMGPLPSAVAGRCWPPPPGVGSARPQPKAIHAAAGPFAAVQQAGGHGGGGRPQPKEIVAKKGPFG